MNLREQTRRRSVYRKCNVIEYLYSVSSRYLFKEQTGIIYKHTYTQHILTCMNE